MAQTLVAMCRWPQLPAASSLGLSTYLRSFTQDSCIPFLQHEACNRIGVRWALCRITGFQSGVNGAKHGVLRYLTSRFAARAPSGKDAIFLAIWEVEENPVLLDVRGWTATLCCCVEVLNSEVFMEHSLRCRCTFSLGFYLESL